MLNLCCKNKTCHVLRKHNDRGIMGQLSFNKNKFYFIGNSITDDELARNLGLKRDGSKSPTWTTRSHVKAQKLRAFANESAELKLKTYFFTHFKRPEQIIYPNHKSPKLFQIESAYHCLTRSPAYCADEAGLGKTITAALCLNTVPGKALVICPPYLKYNWEKELLDWRDDCSWITCVESGDHDESKILDADVVILPDSLVGNARIKSLLDKCIFEWCIVDEAHRFSHENTQRTQAIIKIAPKAKRYTFLSGTPMPNSRPIEMFPLLESLAHETIKWRDRISYGKEFCNGHQKKLFDRGGAPELAWDFTGASNLKRLRRELRETLMIRHLKKDVLPELEPKTRQIIYLDQPKKILKYENAVLASNRIEDLLGSDSGAGEISRYRRECGLAKVPQAVSFLMDRINSSQEKLLVFAHHVEVIKKIYMALNEFNPLVIRGGLSAKEKNKIKDTFQDDPKHKVIIGNIDAMGVGLTLTAARRVIFVEYSWVYGINEQAEDRVHRITQEDNVYVQYLIMRNSLDERMLNSVFRKQKTNEVLMG